MPGCVLGLFFSWAGWLVSLVDLASLLVSLLSLFWLVSLALLVGLVALVVLLGWLLALAVL